MILPNEELLYSFLEFLDEIEQLILVPNYKREKVYKECAPIAFDIFKRFFNPTTIFDHPSFDKLHSPSEVIFWEQPAALWKLFEMLIENKIYYDRYINFRNRYAISSLIINNHNYMDSIKIRENNMAEIKIEHEEGIYE